MLLDFTNGQTSVILRVKLRQDTTGAAPGNGKTGLTNASTGLSISTIADNESSPTTYTSAGATIDTITTLGTFAAPTASHCRFKEVSSTAHPGVYELQIADARYAVASAKSLLVSITGVSGMADCDVVVPLRSVNPYDAVRFGMTALPNVASGNAGALITSGTGTAQLSVSSGVAQADAAKINGVATTSVTTISANIGTTQPTNFTGTGASALVKSDMVDVAGAAVSTSTAQLGVNLVNIGGSAVSTTSAQLGVNIVNIAGAAAALDANNLLKVDAEDWKGSAVSALVSGMVPAITSIRTGTAQAGGASTITLDAGASATNNLYDNELVYIVGGTGAGQTNTVSSYNGTTKVATMIGSWATNPDATSVFIILPAGPLSATVSGNVTVGGYAAGQDPATLVLGATASSWNTASTIGAKINTAGGYSFPTNFSTLSIDASGRVDIGKILGTASAGAAGYVGVDWGHVNAPTTAVNLSGTTISTSQVVASVSGAVGSVTSAVTLSAGDSPTFYTSTATAGGATTLTDSGQTWTVNALAGCRVKITSGTGAKQSRVVVSNTATVLTVDRAWTTNPDATSVYAVVEADAPKTDSNLAVTAGTVSDKTGYSLSQAFPANFNSLAISAGGAVTVGTNNDKTGYSLTQAFPTNFSALAITVGGAVTAGTVSDKTGYSLTQAFPTNFATMSIDTNGRVEIQSGITKNAALNNFEFLMLSSTDHITPITGLTVTPTRSIDGAAFAACANAVTEVGNGIYKINLAASDLNGLTITLRFAATGADDRFFTLVTTP